MNNKEANWTTQDRFDDLKSGIARLWEKQEDEALVDASERARKIIEKIGISKHGNGYKYLILSCAYAATDKSYLEALTTRLFPDVAKAHNTKATTVNTSIRQAIETSFTHGSEELLEYFSSSISPKSVTASNKQVILKITSQIEKELKEETKKKKKDLGNLFENEQNAKTIEQAMGHMEQTTILVGGRGYRYILLGIGLVVADPSYRKGITQRLYPDIANVFESTAQRVNKLITQTIEIAFDNDMGGKMYDLFGEKISHKSGRVTASRFIFTIADKITKQQKV